MTEKKLWKCEHCNQEIPMDSKHAYSRAGHHWCSQSCYSQDHGYKNDPKPVPIMRRKVRP